MKPYSLEVRYIRDSSLRAEHKSKSAKKPLAHNLLKNWRFCGKTFILHDFEFSMTGVRYKTLKPKIEYSLPITYMKTKYFAIF